MRRRLGFICLASLCLLCLLFVWLGLSLNDDDETEDRVSLTAYLTLGARLRALDSRSPLYTDEQSQVFEDATSELSIQQRLLLQTGRWMGSDDSLIRHRIVEDLLLLRSGGRRSRLIISIGAGFDTRPCRLLLGSAVHWIEIDRASIVRLKDRLLTRTRCPVKFIERIALDKEDSLLTIGLPLSTAYDRVDVLLEGVWMYLTIDERDRLLSALQQLYTEHRLIVDLLSDDSVPSLSAAFSSALGAPWYNAGINPASFFRTRNYCLKKAVTGSGTYPLRPGYAVYEFEFHSAPHCREQDS